VQGLSSSAAAATELLGNAFTGIVVSDRFSAYNNLPVEQRQLCWAHLIRDLTAIAQRSGASAEFGTVLLELQGQLFEHWYHWKEGQIRWHELEQCCMPGVNYLGGRVNYVGGRIASTKSYPFHLTLDNTGFSALSMGWSGPCRGSRVSWSSLSI
jgi:hypothetical protein